MSKNIGELNTAELAGLVAGLKALAPAHTHWTQVLGTFGTASNMTGELGTWSTPDGMWSIEINYQTNRYVVRQGTDNKWTRFDDDLSWLESTLIHLGGLA